MDFKNLSPEFREKAKDCTSPEELIALAKKEGYRLSVDDLDVVAGGECSGVSPYSCRDNYELGDSRADIDPDLISAAFRKGEDTFADLDW